MSGEGLSAFNGWGFTWTGPLLHNSLFSIARPVRDVVQLEVHVHVVQLEDYEKR